MVGDLEFLDRVYKEEGEEGKERKKGEEGEEKAVEEEEEYELEDNLDDKTIELHSLIPSSRELESQWF